jgi:hypothetical protein
VPESGRINVDWDCAFLEDFLAHRREALTRYSEEEIERDDGGVAAIVGRMKDEG